VKRDAFLFTVEGFNPEDEAMNNDIHRGLKYYRNIHARNPHRAKYFPYSWYTASSRSRQFNAYSAYVYKTDCSKTSLLRMCRRSITIEPREQERLAEILN
jgi:hypothetical protein